MKRVTFDDPLSDYFHYYYRYIVNYLRKYMFLDSFDEIIHLIITKNNESQNTYNQTVVSEDGYT